MKIERVDGFLLSFPLDPPVKLSYWGGERTIVKRDAMLVRVQAGNGLIGYGPGQGSEAAHDAIRDIVAPFLTGRSLLDPDALRASFVVAHGAAALKYYSMVEVALYDLLGKALGVPVSELVGGRVRSEIRLYASAGMYQPPESYAEEAAGVAGLGFVAYKMRPALGPDEDVRTVELMRRAVGSGVDIMVDAHSWWRMGNRSYDRETVRRLAGEMAKHDIAWLEEPLPPADHEAYAALREAGLAPIAGGEHEPGDDGFLDLILSHCVDYVQLDVVCQGGYASARRVLAETERYGLRFAFHCWGTDLEVAAAAQVGVCWPDHVAEWLEYPVYSTPRLRTMYPFPLATEILSQPLDISGGMLSVPTEPGLGVEVNEQVITKYPWIAGPWSYFTLIDPPGTFAVTGDHSVPWTTPQ